MLYLTETLAKSSQRSAGSSTGGLRELVAYKPFQTVVMVYSINNGVMFSWEAIYPLFAYTSVELGGLGLEVRDIMFGEAHDRSRPLEPFWLSRQCCRS